MNASKITCHVGHIEGSLYDAVGDTPPNAFPFWASPFYTFLFCFLCKSASFFAAWAILLKQLATRRRTDPREPLTKIPLIHLRSNSTMQFLTITTVVALAAARPFHNEARTLAVDLVGRSPKAWLQGSPAPKCNDRKVVDSNSHLENQRFLPLMENLRFSETWSFFVFNFQVRICGIMYRHTS